MIAKEELVIFEYELAKLMEEYQKCVDQSLKKKIQEDVKWLETSIFSAGTHEQTIEN